MANWSNVKRYAEVSTICRFTAAGAAIWSRSWCNRLDLAPFESCSHPVVNDCHLSRDRLPWRASHLSFQGCSTVLVVIPLLFFHETWSCWKVHVCGGLDFILAILGSWFSSIGNLRNFMFHTHWKAPVSRRWELLTKFQNGEFGSSGGYFDFVDCCRSP